MAAAADQKQSPGYPGDSIIYFHENAFENVVCEMAAIVSRPQCVDT